jgi:hypothetical protein
MSLSFRWRVRICLLLIFAAWAAVFAGNWLARFSPPHLGPWYDCRRDSTLVQDAQQFMLEQVRWRGQRLECEFCVTNIEKRPFVFFSERPWVSLNCEFHDKRGHRLDTIVTVDRFWSSDLLEGEPYRHRFWFAVPIPPMSRTVAVRVGRGRWLTNQVKVPPKPGILSNWL